MFALKESYTGLPSVEAINSASTECQQRDGLQKLKTGSERRNRQSCAGSLTGMFEARLHAPKEPQSPLPGFELPVPVRVFPLTGTLAPDLGLKLGHSLLSLLHQGGQMYCSALQAHD